MLRLCRINKLMSVQFQMCLYTLTFCEMIAAKRARYLRSFSLGPLTLLLITANHLRLSQTQNTPCPAGYVQYGDGPCQPDQQLRCPPGTVFMNEECRKIMCPLGELYNDMCLQAACPPGLVWRGKRCQEPGYLTTIIEIENVLTNEMHKNPMYYDRSVINAIVMHNSTLPPSLSTTSAPTTSRPLSIKDDRGVNTQRNGSGCCTVRTPRICKRYEQKWICFNRSLKRCDSRVCTASIVYLKAPEIKYTHPLLIMPPDPLTQKCTYGNCRHNDTALPDCSGCATNHPENCSSYCFLYMCPPDTCSFMNLDLYCSYYPGQFGCIKEDGCLWNWC